MFSALSSVMSTYQLRRMAEANEARCRLLMAERGETYRTIIPEPIVSALTERQAGTRVIERDTGMGWGTIIAAFVIGGMLS